MATNLEWWRAVLGRTVVRRGSLQHPDVLAISRVVDQEILAVYRNSALLAAPGAQGSPASASDESTEPAARNDEEPKPDND